MTLHLLTGDDESLLRSATGELIHELVGDGDRSMMVDDFDMEQIERMYEKLGELQID